MHPYAPHRQFDYGYVFGRVCFPFLASLRSAAYGRVLLAHVNVVIGCD
jgi:hypothetical protein